MLGNCRKYRNYTVCLGPKENAILSFAIVILAGAGIQATEIRVGTNSVGVTG